MIVEVALPVPIYKLFDYRIPGDIPPETFSHLRGCRVRVPFGHRVMAGVVCSIKETSSVPDAFLKPFLELLDAEPLLDEALMKMADWVSAHYLCPKGEALSLFSPPEKNKKWENLFLESHSDENPFPRGDKKAPLIPSSQNLNQAIQVLHEAVFSHEPRSCLIQGGGAAERDQIYFAVVKDALQQGRSAIILVPEIASAERVSKLLADQFGSDRVCLWHGNQKPQERWKNWHRASRSEVSIVVGTRSAVFAPLKNIGIIIVDDEHSSAYKEERRPRFHARDIARERARQNSSVFVMGSASPSVPTYYDVIQGAISLLDLNFIHRRTPAIHVIDMKLEKRRGLISSSLENALSHSLKNRQKAILILNRLGFHKAFRCFDCSWMALCTHCSVRLVPHVIKGPSPVPVSKVKGSKNKTGMTELACRICERKGPAPLSCPECGGKKIKAVGAGTERVVEEVKEKFPWCRVVRLDSQSENRNDADVEDFDILVGTELVVHGFHFPRVNTVGLIDADIPLRIPDFRASEKTFQQLMHLINEMKCETVGADIFIQTRNPDHYAFQYFQSLDYKGFVESELKYREELNYPPISQLIQVRSEDKNEKKAEAELERFVEWVGSVDSTGAIGILGPTHIHSAKPRSRAISQVLLKIPNLKMIDFLEHSLIFLSKKPNKLWFDVNPESLS